MEITHESEAAALIASSDDAIWSESLAGTITSWNLAAQRLFGYAAEEVLGESGRILSPRDRLDEEEEIVAAAVQGGCGSHFETVRRRKDGGPIDVAITLSPIRTASREVTGVSKIAREIGDKKKLERELDWTLSFVEALADSHIDGVLVVDLLGRRLLQNPLMSALWSIPEFIAEDPDYQKQLQYVTTRTKNPQQFIEKVTHLYTHPNESSRDEIELIDGTVLDRTSRPVIGRDGTCFGRAWTFRDITYRKQAIGQLDEQSAAFGSRLRALWAILEREGSAGDRI